MDSNMHFHTEIITVANALGVGISYHSVGVIFVVGGLDEDNLLGRCAMSIFKKRHISV